MKPGYIALYRKIQDNFLWKERREFSKAEAWIDILMEVRWSQEPESVVIGNTVLTCHYAESLKSLETWARRWNWSKAKVRRVFDLFQKCSMIEYKTETVTTRIRVCNYEQYDPRRNASETQVKRDRNAIETRSDPEEERKESKNVKKEKKKQIQYAPSPLNGSKPAAALFTIPLVSGTEFPITQADIDEWQKVFPAVNVHACVLYIRTWNTENPQKRKTSKGIRKHITNWLAREQDKGGGTFKAEVAPPKKLSWADKKELEGGFN